MSCWNLSLEQGRLDAKFYYSEKRLTHLLELIFTDVRFDHVYCESWSTLQLHSKSNGMNETKMITFLSQKVPDVLLVDWKTVEITWNGFYPFRLVKDKIASFENKKRIQEEKMLHLIYKVDSLLKLKNVQE
jgi:hypothetical protein